MGVFALYAALGAKGGTGTQWTVINHNVYNCWRNSWETSKWYTPINMTLLATPWNENSFTCTCCGGVSHTIWGEIGDGSEAVAVYYVSWTEGEQRH